MDEQTRLGQQYVLGNDAEELARLDHQAASIERPTRLLLQAAGIQPGMRVLDLGTGLGHVARLVGEMVGPTGTVIGLDQSAAALAVARERTLATGAAHVSFVEGDVTTWTTPDFFDAVIGRLLLFHVADPVAVVRHHAGALRRGGMFVAIDFDIGGARTDPPVDLPDRAIGWVHDGFRAGGASPHIGARLGRTLEDAGLAGTTMFGVQPYIPAHDPSAAALVAGVVRSLAPTIVRHGIASEEEIGLATLEDRLRDAMRAADAVLVPPTVVGAWGRAAS
jgi:SAM-dependent methyltransferase